MHFNFATLFSAFVVFALSSVSVGQDAAVENGNNLNSRVMRATMPNTARTSADNATPTVAPENASPAAVEPAPAAPASDCADGSCSSRVRGRRVVTRSVVSVGNCPCDETRTRTVTRYSRRVFPLFARRGCCN